MRPITTQHPCISERQLACQIQVYTLQQQAITCVFFSGVEFSHSMLQNFSKAHATVIVPNHIPASWLAGKIIIFKITVCKLQFTLAYLVQSLSMQPNITAFCLNGTATELRLVNPIHQLQYANSSCYWQDISLAKLLVELTNFDVNQAWDTVVDGCDSVVPFFTACYNNILQCFLQLQQDYQLYWAFIVYRNKLSLNLSNLPPVGLSKSLQQNPFNTLLHMHCPHYQEYILPLLNPQQTSSQLDCRAATHYSWSNGQLQLRLGSGLLNFDTNSEKSGTLSILNSQRWLQQHSNWPIHSRAKTRYNFTEAYGTRFYTLGRVTENQSTPYKIELLATPSLPLSGFQTQTETQDANFIQPETSALVGPSVPANCANLLQHGPSRYSHHHGMHSQVVLARKTSGSYCNSIAQNQLDGSCHTHVSANPPDQTMTWRIIGALPINPSAAGASTHSRIDVPMHNAMVYQPTSRQYFGLSQEAPAQHTIRAPSTVKQATTQQVAMGISVNDTGIAVWISGAIAQHMHFYCAGNMCFSSNLQINLRAKQHITLHTAGTINIDSGASTLIHSQQQNIMLCSELDQLYRAGTIELNCQYHNLNSKNCYLWAAQSLQLTVDHGSLQCHVHSSQLTGSHLQVGDMHTRNIQLNAPGASINISNTGVDLQAATIKIMAAAASLPDLPPI